MSASTVRISEGSYQTLKELAAEEIGVASLDFIRNKDSCSKTAGKTGENPYF